ncbi:hypothetical protein [Allosalinactinospora lopnorensis]|uniref:hypothetical protein n=1 Tax=Allosalinactinospora lopnorensis TaxID=1352348 RepID=UPI0012E2D4CE|nr:hypothetical protein [Allosalinactinospora lopnorensis]
MASLLALVCWQGGPWAVLALALVFLTAVGLLIIVLVWLSDESVNRLFRAARLVLNRAEPSEQHQRS